MLRLVSLCLFLLLVGSSAAQKQTIALHGYVMDLDGLPVTNAEICIGFNKKQLAVFQTNEDGSYQYDFVHYGCILELDFQVSSYYHKTLKIMGLPVADGICSTDFCLKPIHTGGILIRAYTERGENMYWERKGCGLSLYSYSVNIPFRSPYGTFAYIKPGSETPLRYYNKMTHHIRVTDKQKIPIEQARIMIRYRGEKMYWSLTDHNGNSNLYQQFDWAARNGKITITADGYHTKRVLHKTFGPMNDLVFVLKKKKQDNSLKN